MSGLDTFVFDDDQPRAIRVVMKDGEPWFIAKDVCAVLGIKDASDAVEPLDDDEKGRALTPTLGGEQDMLTVSEGGLYTLILRSRQATTSGSLAHRFRRWVTSELLPQVRKTGRFAPAADAIDWEEAREKLALVRELRLTSGKAAAARLWAELGLPMPAEEPAPTRADATQGVDFVRLFLKERTAEAPGGRVSASELYRAFCAWCTETGTPVMTMTAFGLCARRCGLSKSKVQTVFYLGLRILHLKELVEG